MSLRRELDFNDFSGNSFKELQQEVEKVLSIPLTRFSLFYQDQEGDRVILDSENDFQEAIHYFKVSGTSWKILVEIIETNLYQPKTDLTSELVKNFESVQVAEDDSKEIPSYEVERTPPYMMSDSSAITTTIMEELTMIPSTSEGIVETKDQPKEMKRILKLKEKEQRAERKREKFLMKRQNKLEKKSWKHDKPRLLKNKTLMSEEQLKELESLRCTLKEKKGLMKEKLIVLKMEIATKKVEMKRLKKEKEENLSQLRKEIGTMLGSVTPQTLPPNYEESFEAKSSSDPIEEREKRRMEREQKKLLRHNEKIESKKERKELKEAQRFQRREDKTHSRGRRKFEY